MPTSDYDLTREYLLRRYQEAQVARRLAQVPDEAPARRARPGLLDLLALKAGELLVFCGLKLKGRYWTATGRPRHFLILDLGPD
jgi:hypothetical protein